MIGKGARGLVLVMIVVLIAASAAALPFVSMSTASRSGVAVADLPPRTGVPPVNFTLFGNAGRGWGFSNSTISEPGPNITVYLGDVVNLTLIANDLDRHNWFIDYDNSLAPNGAEPSSPIFNNATVKVVVWQFAADQPGNWTYRCRIHPTSMTGTIRVLEEPRRVNLTLYGNAGRGWGFSNATIREPGPSLVVLWRTNVTITLIANDLAEHNWFIDYDNSLAPNGAEPSSPIFNNDTVKVVVWSFIADQTGNWTYRCRVHPPSMTGSIVIVGGPPVMLRQGVGVPLISGIMLGALAFVLAFAAIYHVRAVRASKRMK